MNPKDQIDEMEVECSKLLADYREKRAIANDAAAKWIELHSKLEHLKLREKIREELLLLGGPRS